MTPTDRAPATAPAIGSARRWLPVVVLVLAVPFLTAVATETAAGADTEAPEWGNATRGNATTIDVYLYDNGTLDTSTIQPDDFMLTAGRIQNVTVASVNTTGANRTGARVSLVLANKVDVDNVTVSLRDTAAITDEAGNELPRETVTVTGMDSVVPKYRAFEVERLNSSTARVSVETHEPLRQLRISVGGASLDTLNISEFTERTGSNSITYAREYTFPEEGEYSLLLMEVTDRNGNDNSFGRQRSFLYDGSAPNVTIEGPENATVGQSVTFSAANSTDDQGIDAIRWQVGGDTILTGEHITVAFARPGSHRVTVTATDPLGNTETVTRVVSVTGEGTVGNVTVTRPNETMATVSITGTGGPQLIQPSSGPLVNGQNGSLERLEATFPRNDSASVTVRSRGPPTSFASATDHTALSRFDVDHGTVPAEDVTFTFTVDRAALEAAGAGPGDVTLFRRQDGGWTPLDTAVGSRSQSHVVYRASSPGLSTFVVGAKPSAAETSTPEESTPTTQSGQTATPTAETGHPDIVITDATATPAALAPGDQTVITVELENRGTATGDHRVVVGLNATVLASRTVTVPAGETRTTEFARGVPENATGDLTVDGQRVGNVTAAGGGGLPIPALPSVSLPNPLSLWPDGIVGTVLGGLLGVAIGLYGVLKALAIYLGY